MEYMSIPKVSTVHQGFAGTFTHMDGNDGEEKERKKHLWSSQNKNIWDSSGLKCNTQQNDTEDDDVKNP